VSPRFPYTRRRFLRSLGAGALASSLLGRRLGAAASIDSTTASPERVLRHASFGAGGQAWLDIQALCSNPFVKLVAVADVDFAQTAEVRAAFPKVRVYRDWRVLLEREAREIDSVNVSTPDHTHAPMALAAMQLGKHVYCQKPLAHSLHETRVLTEYARGRPLVTQMGIQVHTQRAYRRAVALIRGGAIGRIREVHTWSNKKWGDTGAPPPGGEPIPADFAWDLWLGGCAERPFVGEEYYHPGNWRKRLDFGTGTFGDMGCHIFDPVFEALALGAPISVRSEGPAPDAWNWAIDARIHYVFPGTPYTDGTTVPVTWYDGDERAPDDVLALVIDAQMEARRRNLREDQEDPLGQGSIFIGTKGVMHLPHIGNPRLFPAADFEDFPMPNVIETHHWTDWAEACVGGPGRPLAPFDYSGPLTEAVLLGSVAVRFPHTTLEWDAVGMRFPNHPPADAFVRRDYRPGWRIEGF
jgi:hypothetical protein